MLVLPAAAEPVVLLGDVGELEVGGERAQDRPLQLEVEALDRRAQLVRRLASASCARQAADALLEREHVLALLLDDDPPQDVAEQPDVATKRRLTVGPTPGRGGGAHTAPFNRV